MVGFPDRSVADTQKQARRPSVAQMRRAGKRARSSSERPASHMGLSVFGWFLTLKSVVWPGSDEKKARRASKLQYVDGLAHVWAPRPTGKVRSFCTCHRGAEGIELGLIGSRENGPAEFVSAVLCASAGTSLHQGGTRKSHTSKQHCTYLEKKPHSPRYFGFYSSFFVCHLQNRGYCCNL